MRQATIQAKVQQTDAKSMRQVDTEATQRYTGRPGGVVEELGDMKEILEVGKQRIQRARNYYLILCANLDLKELS